LAWNTFGRPVWDALVSAVKWVGEKLAAGFEVIARSFRVLGYKFQSFYYQHILPVWRGLVKAATAAWKWIDANVIKPFILGVRVLWPVLPSLGPPHAVPATNGT